MPTWSDGECSSSVLPVAKSPRRGPLCAVAMPCHYLIGLRSQSRLATREMRLYRCGRAQGNGMGVLHRKVCAREEFGRFARRSQTIPLAPSPRPTESVLS